MPRPRVYRREGLVLRQMDYAEADRILTIITPEGKYRVVAKGIRRPTSRKAGHLGLFTRADMMLAQGRNLDIVTQAQSLEEFEGIRRDLTRFSYACYVGEIVDRVAQEEEENPALYRLLLTALRWMDVEEDLALGARLFELRLLDVAGYRPELFECVSCQATLLEETNYISPAEGGVLCPRCGAAQGAARAVSVSTQKVLRYLQRHSVEEVRRLRVSQATHAELEAVLSPYLEYTLERDFKSADFLRRLRRELAAGSLATASGQGAPPAA